MKRKGDRFYLRLFLGFLGFGAGQCHAETLKDEESWGIQ